MNDLPNKSLRTVYNYCFKNDINTIKTKHALK